jgi:multiple sugar transport system permease protein
VDDVEETMKSAEARAALLFLAPAMFILAVFFFAPVLAGFALSLTDFDLYTIGDVHNLRFVAFRNYSELLTSGMFWQAFTNTLYFAVIGGPLTVAVSLVAALLINAKLTRAKAFFRTVYFAPVVTTLVAVSIVFKYLYHPRFGVVNRALGAMGIPTIDWLGDPKWAMFSIVLLAIWRQFGYSMIIFVAGLQTIPDELYEAARIDGAGAWKQFRHVTLPMLGPTFLFVGIVTVIGFLQLFAEPYVMTRGGPLNKTVSMVMLMYEQGFRWWRMGYAAAVAFILFLLIGSTTLLQMKLQGDKR